MHRSPPPDDKRKDAKAAAPMEEDLPPPPKREVAPIEAKASKETRAEKTDGREKPAAEPMSVDKEPPAKVWLGLSYSWLPFAVCMRAHTYAHACSVMHTTAVACSVSQRHDRHAHARSELFPIKPLFCYPGPCTNKVHVMCRLRQMVMQTSHKRPGFMWVT